MAPSGSNGSLTEPCGRKHSCSLPSFPHPLTSKSHREKFLQNKASEPGKLLPFRDDERLSQSYSKLVVFNDSCSSWVNFWWEPCGKRTWTMENITGFDIETTHTRTHIRDVNENQLNWWCTSLNNCYWLNPHTFTFISKSCLAANVWLPSINLNIFPASPPCVFAEIDSDGLLDWGTLGNWVSWQDREVCSRTSLWAMPWPDAHCTSSDWPQPPQHKQFTSVEWSEGIWETISQPAHLGAFSWERSLFLRCN